MEKKTCGLAHAGLYTAKLDETIAFYETVFGAENLGRFQASTRGCWLKLGEDILEIFESDALPEGSFKHLAIASPDTDALYRKALENGAESVSAPRTISLALAAGPMNARIAFVRGVNGEQLELWQYL